MRQFYKVFQKWQTMSAKLSWSHYCEILWFDENKFQYYAKIAESSNLSIRQLRERIKTNEYEILPIETKNKLVSEDKIEVKDLVPNPILIRNNDKLKITEFKVEYIAQVQKYMNYIDKNIKEQSNNNTIGILICKRKNGFVIEYCSDERIANYF